MKNYKKRGSIGLACGAAIFCIALPAAATPITLGALSTFEDRGTLSAPDSDIFAIRNDSDAGIRISSVTIDLSGTQNGAIFDTADGYIDANYDYGDGTGYPITGINSATVGLIEPSIAQQDLWEEATSITLDFADFDTGEIFVFTTDLDDLVDWRVFGFEMQGATFTVTFEGGALLQATTLAAQYFNNTDTPEYNDAVAQAAATATIPEPGTLALFAAGLLGLTLRRKMARSRA